MDRTPAAWPGGICSARRTRGRPGGARGHHRRRLPPNGPVRCRATRADARGCPPRAPRTRLRSRRWGRRSPPSASRRPIPRLPQPRPWRQPWPPSASRAARFAASSASSPPSPRLFARPPPSSRAPCGSPWRAITRSEERTSSKQRRFLGGAVPRSGGRRATPEEVRRVADVLFDADRPRSGSRETSRALCLDAVPRLGRAGGSVLTDGTGTPSGANNLGLCQQTTRKMHVPIASRSAWDTHARARASSSRHRGIRDAFV